MARCGCAALAGAQWHRSHDTSVALDVSVTSLMFPGPDDEPMVVLRGGQVIAVPIQWALSNAPAESVIWDGNRPKFAPPSEVPDDA